MNDRTEPGLVGIATVCHTVFAIALIGLGILGFVKGDFAPGWSPVPESIPARQALAYLCDFVYLACGVGLLWRRTAAAASRILFAYLLLWLLVLRVPWIVVSPQVGSDGGKLMGVVFMARKRLGRASLRFPHR
jgi:hypothetical protein